VISMSICFMCSFDRATDCTRSIRPWNRHWYYRNTK